MATYKLDKLCVEFIKRVPDQLQQSFTPGGGALPNGYLLSSTVIVDYINRALQQLFNTYWQQVAGDEKKFAEIFPELVKISEPVTVSSGNYIINSPYKDFFKLVGAIKTSDNKYIKPKETYLYTLYLSGEYNNIIAPTLNNPVIIQVNNQLSVFPQNLSETIKIVYIKQPVKSDTGLELIQNGSEDSPFLEHWHNAIVDIAYLKYLEETNQTM